VATDTERSGSWSELEQGFFAAAPPDVPEPPPEAPRFDDLDPIGPARPDWRVRMRRTARTGWAAVSAAPGALRPLVRTVARRSEPMIARARLASIRVSARLVTTLRSRAPDRRMVVAAVAALILVMGVSAGVVASRGAARTTPAVETVAAMDIRGDEATMPAPLPTPTLLQSRPAASDLLTGFEEGALASMVPIEARPAKMLPQPVIRKRPAGPRKHATGPARHAVPAKRLAAPAQSAGVRLPEKTTVAHRASGAERLAVPAARPAFSR